MAGSKINDYGIGDSNIQSVMLTLDKAYKGLHQVSLTNYDNTSASQIAAGSVVENNGALYQFLNNESITGSPSDGTVYIRLVPSGDTITAEYTNTAPTWSDSKQGWYGTGGDANKRYLDFIMFLASTSWKSKDEFKYSFKKNDLSIYEYEKYLYYSKTTDISMSANQTIVEPATAPALGFVKLNVNKIDQDLFSLHNYRTYTFTAKKDGDYYFSGYYFESNINGRTLVARKNGATSTTLSSVGIGGKTFSNILITLKRDDILEFGVNATWGLTGGYQVIADFSIRHEPVF